MTAKPLDTLSMSDIGRLDFRTSRSGDTATAALLRSLGLQFRYQPARLALGKSLGLKTQPAPIDNYDGRTIRGETLFGTGLAGLGVWTSLIVEHANEGPLSRRRLQELVAAHWARGANLLWDNLRKSDDPLGDLADLIAHARR